MNIKRKRETTKSIVLDSSVASTRSKKPPIFNLNLKDDKKTKEYIFDIAKVCENKKIDKIPKRLFLPKLDPFDKASLVRGKSASV